MRLDWFLAGFGVVLLLVLFPLKDCLKTLVKVNINFLDSLMTLFLTTS